MPHQRACWCQQLGRSASPAAVAALPSEPLLLTPLVHLSSVPPLVDLMQIDILWCLNHGDNYISMSVRWWDGEPSKYLQCPGWCPCCYWMHVLQPVPEMTQYLLHVARCSELHSWKSHDCKSHIKPKHSFQNGGTSSGTATAPIWLVPPCLFPTTSFLFVQVLQTADSLA
jgi:hypothetical protein